MQGWAHSRCSINCSHLGYLWEADVATSWPNKGRPQHGGNCSHLAGSRIPCPEARLFLPCSLPHIQPVLQALLEPPHPLPGLSQDSQ